MHMGWLDSLFNTSSDAQDSGKSPGSGWLGPIAGGPPPLPPLPAPQGGSLLDHLVAGAANLTTGGNPLAGLLNAVNGLATGQRTDHAGLALAKQHATMRALMNAGLDSDTAR